MQTGGQPSATVRTNNLPANPNPQVAQRTLPANQGAQPAAAQSAQAPAQEDQATAPAPVASRPRKKRGNAGSFVAGVELSTEEQAAFGRIAMKAIQQNITPQKYIELVKRDVGAELAVWDKVYPQKEETEGSAEG